MKRKIMKWVIYCVINIISISTTLILLLDKENPIQYELMFMLPLTFAVCNILSMRIYKNLFNKPVSLIVISLFLIRNTITPLLMRFGGYSGYIVNSNVENTRSAIMLMVFETALVFLVLYMDTRIKYRKKRIVTKKISSKQVNLLRVFFACSIAFCMIAYILVPTIRQTYTTIFNVNLITSIKVGEILVVGGLQRVLFTLFTVLFGILQILIPVWIMYKVNKKWGENLKAITIALLSVISPLFIVNRSTAKMHIFLLIIVLLLVLQRIFTKSFKKIAFVIIGLSVIPVFTILSLKSANANLGVEGMKEYSILFQAYFPGVNNMAAVFNTSNPNKVSSLFYDIYSAIPFRNSLFGIEVGNRFGTYYNIDNITNSQIAPNSGYGYHYLGFILAPTPSIWLIYVANKYQSYLKGERNLWRYTAYLILIVYASVSPILYNVFIYASRYLGMILPLIIISKYSGKRHYIK